MMHTEYDHKTGLGRGLHRIAARIMCLLTDHAPEGFGLNSVLFFQFKTGTAVMTICNFCDGEMEWYPPEGERR